MANRDSETQAWHPQLSAPSTDYLPSFPAPGLHSPFSAPLLFYLADGLWDPVLAAGLDKLHSCLQAYPVAH